MTQVPLDDRSDGGDRGSSDETTTSDRAQAPGRRTLDLGDALESRATEDRPEAWGERAESDADRLAHYDAQRPPHHGG